MYSKYSYVTEEENFSGEELPRIIDKFTQTFKARTSHNIASVFWEYSG